MFMFVFGVRVHVRGPILRKSTNSTLGKRASFSQNSQKGHPFSEHVRFSWTFSEFMGKSTNYTLGKRASFSQNSQKLHPVSENVRLFHSIRRN